jgi:hypothetical protein
MDYSMVVQEGDEDFAAVVRGSYNIYDPSGGPTGYTDGISPASSQCLENLADIIYNRTFGGVFNLRCT